MPLTVKDLMERMPGAFQPEKAGDADVVIQFHFTGDQQSEWHATIKGGTCEVKEGEAENPTLALTATGEDYVDVITGKLDGMKALMQGKLKLKGDLNLAMKMMEFFKLN
jgi:putative sterol carrier protein